MGYLTGLRSTNSRPLFCLGLSNKVGGGVGDLTGLRSTNSRPLFCLGLSNKTVTTAKQEQTIQKHLQTILPICFFYYKARQRAKWEAKQVTTMLADTNKTNR